MIKVRLNENLLGCPLFRKLMPRKRDVRAVEIGYPVIIAGYTSGMIAAIRYLAQQDAARFVKSAALMITALLVGLVLVFLWVFHSSHVRQEYRKRAERLAVIPEHDFWVLEGELSMAQLQYGSFYLLRDYLYAPHERLLLRYADIASWQFQDYPSALSGTLKNQFLTVKEADGFETRIRIRQRQKLTEELNAFTIQLTFHILQAKHPKGSPYPNENSN